ncbi:MAG: hypothetical protein Q6363_007845 [Candidatus Njordarchaeota archaeon]
MFAAPIQHTSTTKKKEKETRIGSILREFCRKFNYAINMRRPQRRIALLRALRSIGFDNTVYILRMLYGVVSSESGRAIIEEDIQFITRINEVNK